MTAGDDGSEGDVADGLVEPVRQQALLVADAVLGSLPPEEVPATLRAVARFTPSKRLRLGSAALAVALDTDADFRARVAGAAVAAAPELAAAVGDGSVDDHLAADPLDVALLAYLMRPDGWAQTVAAAGRRWRADHAGERDSGAELDQLRAEVTQLRAAARGEAGRVRDAARAAVADAADELSTLRRGVRDRTRELRAAERERDAARAERDAAREQLAAAQALHRTELRRVEGRAAEAARAAGRATEAARRDSRTERVVDDARLWLLVDTIVSAAAGVRRELSLAAPDLRPADVVAAAASAEVPGAGRTLGDPAVLDKVLALPRVHLVVDGYNVTKTGYPELPLADQRTRLATALAALAGRSGAEVTVVWDGAARPPVQPPAPRGVRVLFSAADEIADDLIRRLVGAEPPGRPVLVVTSDQQIVRDTARAGVWSAPSAVLLNRLR